jgi:hypothetical protein
VPLVGEYKENLEKLGSDQGGRLTPSVVYTPFDPTSMEIGI